MLLTLQMVMVNYTSVMVVGHDVFNVNYGESVDASQTWWMIMKAHLPRGKRKPGVNKRERSNFKYGLKIPVKYKDGFQTTKLIPICSFGIELWT